LKREGQQRLCPIRRGRRRCVGRWCCCALVCVVGFRAARLSPRDRRRRNFTGRGRGSLGFGACGDGCGEKNMSIYVYLCRDVRTDVMITASCVDDFYAGVSGVFRAEAARAITLEIVLEALYTCFFCIYWVLNIIWAGEYTMVHTQSQALTTVACTAYFARCAFYFVAVKRCCCCLATPAGRGTSLRVDVGMEHRRCV